MWLLFVVVVEEKKEIWEKEKGVGTPQLPRKEGWRDMRIFF
jgi:hypothetical protein